MAWSMLSSQKFDGFCGCGGPIFEGTPAASPEVSPRAPSRASTSSQNSPSSPQERLLKHLEEFTRVELPSAMPADFRLQLQLVELMSRQGAVLQDLAWQQQRNEVQLNMTQQQLGKLPEKVSRALRRELDAGRCGGSPDKEALSTRSGSGILDGPDVSQVQPWLLENDAGECGRTESNCWQVQAAQQVGMSNGLVCVVPTPGPRAPLEESVQESISKGHLRKVLSKCSSGLDAEPTNPGLSRSLSQFARLRFPMSENSCLRRLVSNPIFDGLCAVVIMWNAITIGLVTQDMIVFTSAYPGMGEGPKNQAVAIMEYGFAVFYIIELFLKLCVFRGHFFYGGDWKWNVFDFLLVVMGVYDLAVELAGWETNNVDVVWLRLLRLTKMLKMLRVVRVMRFFRELRTMMGSIMSSLATLLWSILLLGLTMYIFCLCFMHAIIGLLADTPPEQLPAEILDGVHMYWSTVPQATLTLYLAVTGGADWEPLASPVRMAGPTYFVLFLFYIAFAAFAVLNVLTGLFVDKAMKFSNNDQEEVLQIIREGEELARFVEHFADGVPVEKAMLSLERLERDVDEPVVTEFLRVLELRWQDAEHVFHMLDSEGSKQVGLEDFVACCLCAKGDVARLEFTSLSKETKQLKAHLGDLAKYVQDRFDMMHRLLHLPDNDVKPMTMRALAG